MFVSLQYDHDAILTFKDFRDLVAKFHELLALAKLSQSVVLFLDSLNQLNQQDQSAEDLSWLPTQLPPNVHVVLSTLKDEGILLGLKEVQVMLCSNA